MQPEEKFSVVLAPGQVRLMMIAAGRNRFVRGGTWTPIDLAARQVCSQKDVMRSVETPFVLCFLPGFINAADGGNIMREFQQLFFK